MSSKKIKNLVLLIFSIAFYTWGEKELVILILLSALIDYSCALIISIGYRKIGLYFSIIFNLSILCYFKYSNFIFTNLSGLLETLGCSIENSRYFSEIALPIGISFYTFQTMSYTIDVYRGKVKANKNFINLATYVTLFPQLIAGPIVRYSEIEVELKNRKVTINKFTDGIERFIIGLAKKIIIANNCAFLADGIFNLPTQESSALIAWTGLLAYTFQIYFDFSGYSDMAIGLGKMLGFNFPENFNYPYTSKSIQEFWRRWHITLSSWFKDYLYIPLGGNRKGIIRTYLNLFIVFFITGLWHGASWNFVIWGIGHGLFLILERLGLKKLLNKLGTAFSITYTFLTVSLLWVFFRSDSIAEALKYFKTLFNFSNATNFDYLNFYLTKETIFILIVAAIFATPVYRIFNNYIKTFKLLQCLKVLLIFLLLIISYFYIASNTYNPFIYFRF